MNLLSGAIIKVMYLTLAHSLWQGLLLAVITTFILLATRNARSARRYNLLSGALGLFAITGCITFLYELSQVPTGSYYTKTVTVEEGSSVTWSEVLTHSISRLPSLSATTDWMNDHAQVIVLLWLSVISIRSLQLILGLRNMRQLRKKVYTADITWLRYTQEVAVKMGIRRVVTLAESALVKVPAVIGYVKPLVLIPAGLMASLPAAEIEAILVHELAHIRRRDYLANLVQNLVEILYFFNPAVWWVSSLIRAEREHCCDDIAVAMTSSKKNYIKALVSCQEYSLAAPVYAMAFAGRRNHLAARAKRLISGRNLMPGRAEKIVLSVCLAVVLVVSTAFLNYARTPFTAQTAEEQQYQDEQQQYQDQQQQNQERLQPVPEPQETPEPAPGSPVPLSYVASSPVPPGARACIAVEDVAALAAPGNLAVVDTPENRHVPPVPPVAPADRRQPPAVAHAPAPPASPKPAPASPNLSDMAGDLIRDGLIKDGLIDPESKTIKYCLTNKFLEVNGVKQPAKIFRKYRDRYQALTDKKGDWKITYVSETNP